MGDAVNLVDEYLRVVGHLLPKDQRDDIIAELKDTILTRIEGREAELGRALTDDEIEASLRDLGHPLVVAARYRPGPQYVVGPALYPYWVFGMKVAVSLGLAISVLMFVIMALAGRNIGGAFGQAIASGANATVTVIGCATTAAWLMDYFGVSVGLEQWRVRDLRYLSLAFFDFEGLRDRAMRVAEAPRWRRATAGRGVGMIATGSVFILWWVGVLHFDIARSAAELRAASLEPGALAAVDWAGLKSTLFWPVLAYGAAIIAGGAVAISQPRAVRLLGAIEVATGAALVALMAWLWTASPLSAAIHVDSLAQLIAQMEQFDRPPPLPMAPMVTVTVAAMTFGGLIGALRGVTRIVFPGLWG